MREMIRPALVLAIVTIVSALSLGATYSVTKNPIERQLELTRTNSMQKILPDADMFEDIEVVEGYGVDSVNQALSDGKPIGYVVGVTTTGYGGGIHILTAIDLQGVIIGVDIVTHSETPGLGAKADSDSYLGQYKGKSQFIGVVKSSAGVNDVEAVTSATITSEAVTSGVNSAMDYFNVYLKGAN